MRWQLQYARSVALGLLPFQAGLRKLKRRLTGISGDITNEPGCMADGLKLLEMVGVDRIRGADVLELGSGWQPFIPLLFKEAGARRVTMTDEHALMDEAYFDRARGVLAEQGHPLAARFSDFIYLAPCDWSKIPSASIDVIWSRAVLEHILPETLATLFAEFRRILRPNGVMAHVIDNSDHWEHKDKSISRVNFLKFGDSVWSVVNFHPLFYQNRLRHSDYLRLITNAGFTIVHEDAEVCARSLSSLQTMRTSERFEAYAQADLATITSRLVAKPVRLH